MPAMPALKIPPRPHQVQAADASTNTLSILPGQALPPEGLRAQVHSATGSGKTVIAQMTAHQIGAARVAVLVPNLDLLAQTAADWRAAGHDRPMFGLCSLKSTPELPCTTDPDELVALTARLPEVTVFATYASVGLGTLQRSHEAGLPPWSLIILDEAHRLSGAAGKPWAAALDNSRIPADRRLSMTATPRIWELAGARDDTAAPDDAEDTGQGWQGGSGRSGVQLIASMDDHRLFGRTVFELMLGSAVDQGIVAPYRIVCVEVSDPAYQSALAQGASPRSERARGLRLAALQAAVLKTAADNRLSRVLTFHGRVAEAKAFAEGLPAAARQLAAADATHYPLPQGMAARWLHGEHPPEQRKVALDGFHAGVTDAGLLVALSVLSSVKVLGVGVDTWCDAVVFCDVVGAMPDIVQALGRALRMRPGDGKVATIVVPVMLGPGESADQMLTSPAYDDLARLLEALRAHDARAVESLAASALDPTPPSKDSATDVDGDPSVEDTLDPDVTDQDDDVDEDDPTIDDDPQAPDAEGLLQFGTPRSAGLLARFISLRVLQPEKYAWRRGLEAALAYQAAHGDLRVPYDYRSPTAPESAPADGFPLGTWIAEQRRARRAGRLTGERVRELEAAGMVWSQFDAAFEDGLTACRSWAAATGHLLPPVDAVTEEGFPVGRWLMNLRNAARAAARAAKSPATDGADGPAGALTAERREALEEIDPSWCPAWPVDWQRAFHHARRHIQDGGTLTGHAPGQLVIQGEDIGRWITTQQDRWAQLTVVQHWLLSSVLAIGPAAAPAGRAKASKPRLSHADKWALNLAAARQHHQREGHLDVPRGHQETVDGQVVKLGVFVANSRARHGSLASDRVAALDALGMRW